MHVKLGRSHKVEVNSDLQLLWGTPVSVDFFQFLVKPSHRRLGNEFWKGLEQKMKIR